MKQINIVAKEGEHELYGIGDVHFRYDDSDEPIYRILIPKANVKITHRGDSAIKYYHLINDDQLSFIKDVKKIAANSCGIPHWIMNKGEKQDEVFFSRYLAAKAIRKHIPHLSLKKVGSLVGGIHYSTVIHGIEMLEDENEKYLKEQQRFWKAEFIDNLDEILERHGKKEKEVSNKTA